MLIRIVGAFTGIFCGYACYWSIRWAVADYVVKGASRPGIEYALRLAPGNPEYYVRLAEAEPALALAAMQRAVELNPLNPSIWIEFARDAEEHHDFPGAERSLLHAVQVDKSFAPRWLLAEFYSRRHDQAHFWPAVRAALETSYDDIGRLFDLCWNFAPEPRIILERAVPNRLDVLRQYFDFLLAKNRLDAADAVATQLSGRADADTVPSLLGYCDRLLAKNDSPRAMEIWNALAAKRLLEYPALAVAQGRVLTDGSFEKPFLARGFDWRMPPVDGIFARQGGASAGLRFEFSGNQPESCELLSEFIPVQPSQPYRLAVRYATNGLHGETGLKWRALDVTTGTDLLSTGGQVTPNEGQEKLESYGFSTLAESRLIRLVLGYQRMRGTVRIEGSLALRNTALGFGP